MNRRRLMRLLPWVLGAGLLVLSIRAVSLDQVIATLQRLELWQIAILIVANALVLVTITGRWWILLRGVGHHLPFLPLFTYRLAAFGLSYFTPGPHVGGEMLQVFMVEKEHDVPRSDSLAAVALDKAIEFSVNLTFLLLGIAAALQWRIVPRESGQQALGLAVALLVLPLAYLGSTALGFYPGTRAMRPFARRWPRFSGATATLAESEAQIGRYFRKAPRPFIAAVAVTLVGWAALIVEYWLMVHFLGVDLTLPQLVTTLTAARISILLFLPAGLGALEASQATAFGLLGLDPAVGISASLLIRLRDTVLGLFGLWWWGSRRVGRQTGGSREENIDKRPPPTDR
jgi:uncharacterized protein (TIRG00374 family)